MADPSELQVPRFPVRMVADRTGLSPHVLRAWERRYGVVSPSRSEGGQRLYSMEDIERLRRLRRLTERGHAIGRIASLSLDALAALEQEAGEDGSGAGPRPIALAPGGTVAEFNAVALDAMKRLDASELQAVLERAAVTLGAPEFLDGMVGPVLEEIGRGWSKRIVTVAEEHLATSAFRRTLGWLLGVYEVKGPAPRLVVATPPGQIHELGALMVAVSAAAEGWSVTYLGPDLPVADLLSAATQTNARAVALSAVYLPDASQVVEAIREVRTKLPRRVSLLLGGGAAPAIRREAEDAGAMVIGSLPELRAQLRRMALEPTE